MEGDAEEVSSPYIELSESFLRLVDLASGQAKSGFEVKSAAVGGGEDEGKKEPSKNEKRKKGGKKLRKLSLLTGPAIPVAKDLETPSTMGVEEIDAFRSRFQIPLIYWCRVADTEERLVRVDAGWVALSTDLFEKGNFRLPLNPFFQAFLNAYGLPPSEVTPNSWKAIGAFMILCDELKVKPSLRLLDLLFELKKAPEGVYYLASRRNKKIFELPSSTHPNRDKYFMCRPEEGWDIPTVWSVKKHPEFDLMSIEEGSNFFRRVKAIATAYSEKRLIIASSYCTEEKLKEAGVIVEGMVGSNELRDRLRAGAQQQRKSIVITEPGKRKADDPPSKDKGPSSPPPPKKSKRTDQGTSSSAGGNKGGEQRFQPQPVIDAPSVLELPPQDTRSDPVVPYLGVSQVRGPSVMGPPPPILIPVGPSDTVERASVAALYEENMFTEHDQKRLGRLWQDRADFVSLLRRELLVSMLWLKGAENTIREVKSSASNYKKKYQDATATQRKAEEKESQIFLENEKLKEELQRKEGELGRERERYRQASDKLNVANNDLGKVRNNLKIAQWEHKEEVARLQQQIAEAKNTTMAEFKASQEFEDAVYQKALPSYMMGIKDCRSFLLDVHPDLDLSALDEMYPEAALPDDETKGQAIPPLDQTPSEVPVPEHVQDQTHSRVVQ